MFITGELKLLGAQRTIGVQCWRDNGPILYGNISWAPNIAFFNKLNLSEHFFHAFYNVLLSKTKRKHDRENNSSSCFICCHNNYHKAEKMEKRFTRTINKCYCLSDRKLIISMCDGKDDHFFQ